MAEEGNDEYQIPFFERVLNIEKSQAELYVQHLTDKGFLKCKYHDIFPHYSMADKGRKYLINIKAI